MKKRVVLYVAALSLAVGALAVNTVNVYGLERDLQRIADAKIAEFKAEEPEDSLAQLRIGASVVATKTYVLFGDVSGKVSVFLQHNFDDESHMEGFEFFFVRDDAGEWTQTDSGMCTSEECTQEGLRVLRALDAK
ncbi:MAG: hypothetical protein QGD90_12695 [Candidatus Hydrogenedentes bacterium]|nr:hypothetical protein [Candidatus Hydrogenedentota bacterium]